MVKRPLKLTILNGELHLKSHWAQHTVFKCRWRTWRSSRRAVFCQCPQNGHLNFSFVKHLNRTKLDFWLTSSRRSSRFPHCRRDFPACASKVPTRDCKTPGTARSGTPRAEVHNVNKFNGQISYKTFELTLSTCVWYTCSLSDEKVHIWQWYTNLGLGPSSRNLNR